MEQSVQSVANVVATATQWINARPNTEMMGQCCTTWGEVEEVDYEINNEVSTEMTTNNEVST